MLEEPLPPPRICTVLYLLLITDLVPVSPVRVVSHSAGDTVILHCLEGINTKLDRNNTTQVTWRKQNDSHILLFALWKNETSSNFTDGRISFLSSEYPLTLQITDAQPSDSGNYTCQITATGGIFPNSWTLHVSENAHFTVVYISASLAGVVVVLIILFGIIYCKKRPKPNKTPSQIHQTMPETSQVEEPLYDNANEDYFLRFNALYDSMPSTQTK